MAKVKFKKHGLTYKNVDPLVLEIIRLKAEARRRGLWDTFGKLNNAEECIGWELARLTKDSANAK